MRGQVSYTGGQGAAVAPARSRRTDPEPPSSNDRTWREHWCELNAQVNALARGVPQQIAVSGMVDVGLEYVAVGL